LPRTPVFRRIALSTPKALGAFLGLGGLLGLGLILDAAPRGSSLPAQWLLWAIVVLLVAFAILAGILLWRGSPWGPPLAMWALLLQIPHFEANGFQYWFYTTASITAFLSTDGNLGVTAAWGTSFQLWLGREVDPTIIGVNLVAAFALYTLYRTSSLGAPAPAKVSVQINSDPPAG
jgi:hypothetical protein